MTGIPILDAIILLVANAFTGIIFLSFMGRLAKMFHNHQYPQLIGTVLFFIFVFAMINAPNETLSLVKNIWGQIKGKIA